jgi:type II secretory pathway pseudopilin PulG
LEQQVGHRLAGIHEFGVAPMKTAGTKHKEPGTLFNASMGFTLLELMIAVGLFSLVIAGSLGVYIMCQRMWRATSLSIDTSRMAGLAIQRMVYGVETNSGLREAVAGMVVLQTNAYGHPYPLLASNKYWETGAQPPSAADPAHYTHVGCSYGTDGSWRLIVSNTSDGVKCFDYNIKMRNILFCPDIDQTSAARSKRILICNYVSSATVTNTNEAIEIRLTVWKKDGMFVSSNQVGAFIKMRN